MKLLENQPLPSGFRLVRKGGIVYLEALKLRDFPFLTHAFLTRQGGLGPLDFRSVGGDSTATFKEKFCLLTQVFGIPSGNFVVLKQIHSDRIMLIKEKKDIQIPLERRFYDAVISNLPGFALGVKTADCAPVLLVEPKRKVVAAIHAGWRGVAANISKKVVDLMVEEFAAEREAIFSAIGPAIGPCCYEVKDDVFRALTRGVADYGEWAWPSPRAGRWMVDLSRIIVEQLKERGVPEKNITYGNFCTSCLPHLFFSHRRDQTKAGRHLNFIILTEKSS